MQKGAGSVTPPAPFPNYRPTLSTHRLPLRQRGNAPAEDCLALDLLGEIGGKPNLGNRGKLPLKMIDMLF